MDDKLQVLQQLGKSRIELESKRATAEEWLGLAAQYDAIGAFANAANCFGRAAYLLDSAQAEVVVVRDRRRTGHRAGAQAARVPGGA